MARTAKSDRDEDALCNNDDDNEDKDHEEEEEEEESKSFPIPASYTKHLDVLYHPLPRKSGVILQLDQLSSSSSTATTTITTTSSGNSDSNSNSNKGGGTGTTGTTLWLSSQVLSAYLSSSLSSPSLTSSESNSDSDGRRKRRRVIELGSGIGYTSISLASQGWQVTSTDIEPVLSTVLRGNVQRAMDNLQGLQARERGELVSMTLKGSRKEKAKEIQVEVGDVVVRELDWVTCARKWSRIQERMSASTSARERCKRCSCAEKVPMDEETGYEIGSHTHTHGRTYGQSGSGSSQGSSTKATSSDTTRADQDTDAVDTLSWLDDDDWGEKGWDMIIMTDTVYATHLIDPLWDTVAYLSWISSCNTKSNNRISKKDRCECGRENGNGDGCARSLEEKEVGLIKKDPSDSDTPKTKSKTKAEREQAIPIYIALEARDPSLIQKALDRGKEKGFTLTKIGRGRIERSFRDAGWDWKSKDWDDVQVWKGRWGGFTNLI